LISGNPELGLRSFLFREEHDGQTPRPASYSKVRAGYFNRLLTKKAEPPPTRDVNRDSGTDRANGG
jgi:hypothetical protein